MSCRTGRNTYHLLQPPLTLMSHLLPDTQLLRFYLPRCLHQDSMSSLSGLDVQDLSAVAESGMQHTKQGLLVPLEVSQQLSGCISGAA